MNAEGNIIIDNDFVANEEPSVLSTDQEERKLARRLRIQRRVQASQKLDEDDNESIIEESPTEKQIFASAELIEKLIAEGNEVISNIRIANDAREIERRHHADEMREKLLNKLKENDEECTKLCDIIMKRWPSILNSNDPLDINNEMELQKKKCDEVLAKKDAMIAQLKLELKKADDEYYEDQRKQKDDIKLLTERIENQMSTMESVYSREMELVKKALKIERLDTIKDFQKMWDDLFKQLENENIEGDKKINKIMKEYEEEMEKVMTDHDEEYRMQKIDLENECQNLERYVEKTKALCFLNAEKLSYNLTILKSKEEENTIVKNQQKRKINKLQSAVNKLKKYYADLKESTRCEIEKLTDQILKAHKNIIELEKKSNHFTRVNEKQYIDIWNMNIENANQLVEQILAADKIIHECTLGISWDPPDKPLPKKEDLPSYRAAVNIIQNRKQDEVERLKILKSEKVDKSKSEIKIEREVLNNVLQQISDCSGYLIEDKLQELISNCNEEEKTIIRLDNVFQVLSISTMEEINIFLEFFLPYSYCPICSAREIADSSSLSNSLDSSKSSTCTEICNGCIDENMKKLINFVKQETEINSECNDVIKTTDSKTENAVFETILSEESKIYNKKTKSKLQTKKFTCDDGHILKIQAAHVTKVMKEIVIKFITAEQKEILSFEERLKENKYTISRNLSIEDVKTFWASYREILNPHKEKLWDAVLIGLNKYYEILKERHKLCKEKESLQKQNVELQRLLQSHIINTEDESKLLNVKIAKYSS